MAKLCLYGGTFSPPHKGHINALRSLIDTVCPDITYIEPTFIPPHKSISIGDDPIHRLNMCKLAFENFAEYGKTLFVDDWEISQGGKSYSVNTLEHFSKDFDITMLIGTDMLLTLHEWYMPKRICELCTIAFMRRNNESKDIEDKISSQISYLKKSFNANILIIDKPTIEISSTQVRSDIAKGIKPSGITDSVYQYIKENNLYG